MDRQLEDKILRIVRDCVKGRGLDTRYLRSELRKLAAPERAPENQTAFAFPVPEESSNAAA